MSAGIVRIIKKLLHSIICSIAWVSRRAFTMRRDMFFFLIGTIIGVGAPYAIDYAYPPTITAITQDAPVIQLSHPPELWPGHNFMANITATEDETLSTCALHFTTPLPKTISAGLDETCQLLTMSMDYPLTQKHWPKELIHMQITGEDSKGKAIDPYSYAIYIDDTLHGKVTPNTLVFTYPESSAKRAEITTQNGHPIPDHYTCEWSFHNHPVQMARSLSKNLCHAELQVSFAHMSPISKSIFMDKLDDGKERFSIFATIYDKDDEKLGLVQVNVVVNSPSK